MKRLIVILLIVVLLTGCGKQEAVVETEPTTVPTTEAPTTAPTTEATEPPTEAPTEPPEPIRNPLNGTMLEEPFNGQIVAFVMNNIVNAQPQHGQSAADIYYEIEAEGGITRCLGLFTNYADVPKIGPIRSVRTYFNILSRAVHAPVIHCGGSTYARDGYVDYAKTQLPDWQHIDASVSNGFYRDQNRRNNGYAYEHTLFTSGERITPVLESKGYNIPEKTPDAGLLFAETPEMNGETATKLKLVFKGGKKTSFEYDQETGLYSASQYGKAWVDGNTDEALKVRNVITLYVEQIKANGGSSRQFYTMIGSGNGHMACDGKIIPIKWSHDSYEEPFQYTLEDGTPLRLGVGKTYIAILGGDPVSYE